MDYENMFYGASPDIFQKAKMLRKNPTIPEKRLWNYLCNKKLGVKFRRQHPLNEYIVDFYCHQLKLVIEIDGEEHNLKNNRENDKIRDSKLSDWGIMVVRVTNTGVMRNIEGVIKYLKDIILEKEI